ncbi:hypothetical protein F383_13212 [Gossypium arboreum]|uniref:Uncharacterized protein n=1 Tax=Gossypium arboreum TaxID=29729 RepID=A0A0B0PX61_GOSAR|nr:hypothetical protein F383_09285 [Gossypium arboreum]KHG29039.1 hypothetical protein F383_13212 [Gossypium arboreum]
MRPINLVHVVACN